MLLVGLNLYFLDTYLGSVDLNVLFYKQKYLLYRFLITLLPLVVGGWCSGDAISSVEGYDPVTKEWRMKTSMCKRRCGVGVAVLDGLLYAVGGHDGASYLNSIER